MLGIAFLISATKTSRVLAYSVLSFSPSGLKGTAESDFADTTLAPRNKPIPKIRDRVVCTLWKRDARTYYFKDLRKEFSYPKPP
jgi:hypothetical protein